MMQQSCSARKYTLMMPLIFVSHCHRGVDSITWFGTEDTATDAVVEECNYSDVFEVFRATMCV